ncbi:MAG: hypothetical protein KJ674_03525 [Nanoarchaeota archaeon]|nr:hypothetical protein [Nanoarchaeota archaeon]
MIKKTSTLRVLKSYLHPQNLLKASTGFLGLGGTAVLSDAVLPLISNVVYAQPATITEDVVDQYVKSKTKGFIRGINIEDNNLTNGYNFGVVSKNFDNDLRTDKHAECGEMITITDILNSVGVVDEKDQQRIVFNYLTDYSNANINPEDLISKKIDGVVVDWFYGGEINGLEHLMQSPDINNVVIYNDDSSGRERILNIPYDIMADVVNNNSVAEQELMIKNKELVSQNNTLKDSLSICSDNLDSLSIYSNHLGNLVDGLYNKNLILGNEADSLQGVLKDSSEVLEYLRTNPLKVLLSNSKFGAGLIFSGHGNGWYFEVGVNDVFGTGDFGLGIKATNKPGYGDNSGYDEGITVNGMTSFTEVDTEADRKDNAVYAFVGFDIGSKIPIYLIGGFANTTSITGDVKYTNGMVNPEGHRSNVNSNSTAVNETNNNPFAGFRVGYNLGEGLNVNCGITWTSSESPEYTLGAGYCPFNGGKNE